jgi:hypothetical protein
VKNLERKVPKNCRKNGVDFENFCGKESPSLEQKEGRQTSVWVILRGRHFGRWKNTGS